MLEAVSYLEIGPGRYKITFIEVLLLFFLLLLLF